MKAAMRRVVQMILDGDSWLAELSCGHRWRTSPSTLEGSYLFCGLCRRRTFDLEHHEPWR